jgi:diaminopimelate decarboxylase
VYIVLEQLSEIDVLLQVAEEMGVTPTAGVRIKLASRGFGRWKESGGEKSKFGLNSAQLMQAIDKLRAAGKLEQSACHAVMRVRIRRGKLLNSHCKLVLRVVRHDNPTRQVLSCAADAREGLALKLLIWREVRCRTPLT